MTPRTMAPALTLLMLAATRLPAQAPKIPAACQPMVDAQRKVITTPHHVYSTEGAARPGDKAKTSEAISAGGVTYVLLNGTWRRTPMTTKDALAQMDENLANATAFSCQHVGDEPVAGVAAAVYTAHNENAGVKVDVRTWVAKGSGLVLRTEDDMDTGGGRKSHISVRYDYTNVQAPAGVR
jgi:hypothetical protein